MDSKRHVTTLPVIVHADCDFTKQKAEIKIFVKIEWILESRLLGSRLSQVLAILASNLNQLEADEISSTSIHPPSCSWRMWARGPFNWGVIKLSSIYPQRSHHPSKREPIWILRITSRQSYTNSCGTCRSSQNWDLDSRETASRSACGRRRSRFQFISVLMRRGSDDFESAVTIIIDTPNLNHRDKWSTSRIKRGNRTMTI